MAKRLHYTSTFQPWWLRVLEHQGLPTVFALLLLAGAWKIGERHLMFIDSQTEQMRMQTRSLETIAGSSIRQESEIEALIESIEDSNGGRKAEHREILDAIKNGK